MTGYVDHLILGAASYQTDYQVLIRIYRGYVQNTGNAIYIPPSECRPDFSDIRFADTAGRLLPYWIETTGTDYADIWVKLYQIPTTGAVVRVLFGGGAIPSAPNGAVTFPTFFDDFSGASVNAANWSTYNSPTSVSVASGVCTITKTSEAFAGLKSVSAIGPYNVAILTNLKYSYTSQMGISNVDDMYTGGDVAKFLMYSISSLYIVRAEHSGSVSDANVVFDNTSYHRDEICWAAGSVKFIRDAIEVSTITTNTPTVAGYIYLQAYNNSIFCDYLVARKYANPEPSHGWWGSLEDL